MAVFSHFRLTLRRAKTWLPRRSGQDTLFDWLIIPLLLTSLGLFALIVMLRKFDGHHTYVTLYPAVIISTLLGGYRAGFVALLVSIGGVVWLFHPLGETPDLLAAVIYVVDCVLIIGVGHAMTTAADRAAEARTETRLTHQLLKSEQLFRAFIEHAPAALAMFDKEKRYIGASGRWLGDFGIEDDSIQGMLYSQWPHAVPHAWEEAMRKALSGEVSRKDEDLIIQPDGRKRWLRWEVRPWIDISGSVAGIVVFSEDVTTQKQAARAAAESEARFRAIIESMQGAMIVTDAAGNIESFNPAAIALFGYSESELLGSNINRLITDFDMGDGLPDNTSDSFTGDVVAPPEIPAEAEGKKKEGTIFPADQMITRWSDAHGEKHWTVIVRDISERRAGEEELGRALRMEAVGRLAGGIAHDFNNLLSIITGNLELATPQITHPKTRTMIRKALDAAERGAAFTQQLLTLARKRQAEFKEVDLNQHVSNIAVLLEHTLGSNVRLRISLAPDLWITRADPVEVDSAIINLAMNAGHAMPNGGTLAITTSNVTVDPKQKIAGPAHPTGEFARISVRDSGTGMTMEVRRRAFEPFFTTKGEGTGTGLGLPSVYSFAQAAGGFITLDSAVGKGTTIEMYIPRLVEGGHSTVVTTPRPRRKQGHGEIILVVEDDRDVREVSVERLRRLGYETLSAGTVSEACQILRENRQIALVFSDIVLTGAKTGYDLARWVERHRPDVNILLTTGYDVGDKQLAQGRDNPFIRRLEKPHTATQLANEIRKALEIDPPGER